MEQFNLDEYLAYPSRKVVTRDGRAVKIHCTNYCSSKFPIVAGIEGRNFSETFTKDGHYNGDKIDSRCDLFFAPEKHEGWINIYLNANRNYEVSCCVYKSKESAEEFGRECKSYITTLKIEWEE